MRMQIFFCLGAKVNSMIYASKQQPKLKKSAQT